MLQRVLATIFFFVNNSDSSSKIFGIVGDGQLGRMMTDAAHTLGIKVAILGSSLDNPAMQVADTPVIGSFGSYDDVVGFAQKADVITFEIESANEEALKTLAGQGTEVHPLPETLQLIKDKFAQKSLLQEKGIRTPDFAEVNSEEDARKFGATFGYPFVLKARKGGYDGKGNATVRSQEEIPAAFSQLGTNLYAERFVSFTQELAIVAARTRTGDMSVYPLVTTVHTDHICDTVTMPAQTTDTVRAEAESFARQVLGCFHGAGVFAIEMFLENDRILVNEIAPRVHNSGHLTIEANDTSQFEQHVRAVMNMPLGSVAIKAPFAIMKNILGMRDGVAEPQGKEEAEALPGVRVHWYGKKEVRIKRKMGHITATGNTLAEVQQKIATAFSKVKI